MRAPLLLFQEFLLKKSGRKLKKRHLPGSCCDASFRVAPDGQEKTSANKSE